MDIIDYRTYCNLGAGKKVTPTSFGAVKYQSLSIGYTPRCRSLCDLHHRWPQARGGVRSIETEQRCVTDLYHGNELIRLSIMILYICQLKGCKDLVMKLAGV